MKSIYRAVIVASGLALAGHLAAQDSSAPPATNPPAPNSLATPTDTNAAPAAGAATGTGTDRQSPPPSSGATADTSTTVSASTSTDTIAAPAPVADQRPVVAADDAAKAKSHAPRSLWLLIVGLAAAVVIVATRLSRRAGEAEISIRGDRTGPIRTDGGPTLSGRS